LSQAEVECILLTAPLTDADAVKIAAALPCSAMFGESHGSSARPKLSLLRQHASAPRNTGCGGFSFGETDNEHGQ
jgi:hypothetical protein